MAALLTLLPLVYAALASAQASTEVNWGNVTGTSNAPFPTDVGFLGKEQYNTVTPFNAQVDKINSSFPGSRWGVETRWTPRDAKGKNGSSDDIFRNLGTTSPYHVADDLFPETHGKESVPERCELQQVHILHRHGARFPTSSAVEGAPLFGQVIANASKAGKLNATGELAFLNQWNYSLGAEVLVHQGTQELFDAGVKHYYDYAKLLDGLPHRPIVRTTSQSRMLDSARYWTLGFFGWDAPTKVDLEVLTEAKGQNNTLAPYYACTNANNPAFYIGDKLANKWRSEYLANATKRLQPMLKGVKLNTTLVYGMASMCAYETVGLGLSSFCPLFTKEEWEGFQYDQDLQFQGDYGFMNPSGKAQGVGWVLEFLDRVQKQAFTGPVTGQNTTLNQNRTYFPFDQGLYADFTHDSVITSVLTALNYTQFGAFLPATKPDANRTYRSSRVTPFGARLVFEVMSCKNGTSGNATSFIRTKINEAVIPMNKDQGCATRPDGLCNLNDFVLHQLRNAYKDSKFNTLCFGENGKDFNVTGPVRNGTL
ncbi:hypothetical protein MSPP1_002022 [Malassezia sp. CBS 17886]|nr:hypothetical protein MSPP1_002022 [Malassezia sp. CBS 17886]